MNHIDSTVGEGFSVGQADSLGGGRAVAGVAGADIGPLYDNLDDPDADRQD